jgi:ABC-type amino acid transport substrate-binding protein
LDPETLVHVGRFAVVAALISLLPAACGGGDSGEEPAAAPGAEAGDPATDKLAQVVARGTLTLSTDLRYPPQSFAVKRAKRAPGSRCPANQLTAPQVAGYDATGELVAKVRRVEPCFVTPLWTEITAGKCSDRWDIAFGSGAITADRMTRLWMTAPYRAEAQPFYVREDSFYRCPSDLDGKRIGVRASCSVEACLKGELELPGVRLTRKLERLKIVAYDVDRPGSRTSAGANSTAMRARRTSASRRSRKGSRSAPWTSRPSRSTSPVPGVPSARGRRPLTCECARPPWPLSARAVARRIPRRLPLDAAERGRGRAWAPST